MTPETEPLALATSILWWAQFLGTYLSAFGLGVLFERRRVQRRERRLDGTRFEIQVNGREITNAATEASKRTVPW